MNRCHRDVLDVVCLLRLLIPLIFCIFPSLLMVLLGPVLISFQQHFHPQAVGA